MQKRECCSCFLCYGSWCQPRPGASVTRKRFSRVGLGQAAKERNRGTHCVGRKGCRGSLDAVRAVSVHADEGNEVYVSVIE